MTFPTLTRVGQADPTRLSPGATRAASADPVLSPRPYLMKCPGSDLVSCVSCTRRIAPAAEANQRWVEPPRSGACSYYANIDEVGWVYGHGTQPQGPCGAGEGGDQQ